MLVIVYIKEDVRLIGKAYDCKSSEVTHWEFKSLHPHITGDFSSMVERFFVAEDISVRFCDFTLFISTCYSLVVKSREGPRPLYA